MTHTYCIGIMSWLNYFVSSDNPINREKATQWDFVNLSSLDMLLNKKSIAFIKLVKSYNELMELWSWKVEPKDYPHLRPWQKLLEYDLSLTNKQNVLN